MKQWAADSSQRSPTTVAPQKCLDPSFRLACHGTSPDTALIPPTIRVGLSIAGLAPHSARGEERRGWGWSRHPLWVHPFWAQSNLHTEQLGCHPGRQGWCKMETSTCNDCDPRMRLTRDPQCHIYMVASACHPGTQKLRQGDCSEFEVSMGYKRCRPRRVGRREGRGTEAGTGLSGITGESEAGKRQKQTTADAKLTTWAGCSQALVLYNQAGVSTSSFTKYTKTQEILG